MNYFFPVILAALVFFISSCGSRKSQNEKKTASPIPDRNKLDVPLARLKRFQKPLISVIGSQKGLTVKKTPRLIIRTQDGRQAYTVDFYCLGKSLRFNLSLFSFQSAALCFQARCNGKEKIIQTIPLIKKINSFSVTSGPDSKIILNGKLLYRENAPLLYVGVVIKNSPFTISDVSYTDRGKKTKEAAEITVIDLSKAIRSIPLPVKTGGGRIL